MLLHIREKKTHSKSISSRAVPVIDEAKHVFLCCIYIMKLWPSRYTTTAVYYDCIISMLMFSWCAVL